MLSESQREEFFGTGLLGLRGAMPSPEADRMCDRIWEFMAERHGIDRDDESTWTVEAPTGFQPLARSGAFAALMSPVVAGAIEALIGGGRGRDRGRALVTFPQRQSGWSVPGRSWHFDYTPLQKGMRARPIQIFAALNDVRPRGGGTLVLTGSHRLVARYIQERGDPRLEAVRSLLGAADPWLDELWHGDWTGAEGAAERIRRYMEGDAVVDGVRLRVVELTGGPGDVYLMHSDCFHTMSPNCADAPRIMLTSIVGPEPAGD